MFLSERLKALREQSGDTQGQLASALNVAQTTVSGWEIGTREPSFDLLNRIADRYSVTTDYLLGRSPSPNVVVQPVGETNRQAAAHLMTDHVTLSDAERAALLAAAQSSGGVVIDPDKLGMPKNREEFDAMVRKLIDEARKPC
ncbi:hypothetical protein AGMMS49992_26080 [Clostridia bacterium]|nr:hypothetical protein AGMMS49992_26080 [Clostridia bacterium]